MNADRNAAKVRDLVRALHEVCELIAIRCQAPSHNPKRAPEAVWKVHFANALLTPRNLCAECRSLVDVGRAEALRQPEVYQIAMAAIREAKR